MSQAQSTSRTRVPLFSLRKAKPKRTGLSRLKPGLIRERTGLRAQVLLAVLVTALLVSLGVAALRIDLLRVRYALAAATLEEQRLLDESRTLTAQMRRLRDPYHLALQAKELGFVRPARLIDLRDSTLAKEPLPERVAAHRPNAALSLP
ncbi:MAG: hypothetical protein VX252_01755 [Myxococcota bacterium]|nr:hypothetical protein [Myxococcota bacterium]